jgi:salicylate hydroxylase
MKNQLFHIAGGGVAGLASALAVAKSGNSAALMEKATQFEMIGAGLQLGPNAVRALQRLDAWDSVEAITSQPPEIQIRDGRSGKTLNRIELGKKFETRFGLPYRVAHRADLVQALLNVAKTKSTVTIKTNAEVIARNQFDGHALIAADGVWSTIRETLFPNQKAIISKDVIHRCLSDRIKNQNVTLWFFPGGHVVHYPVGHPEKLNLVAVTQGTDVKTHFSEACDELQEILSDQNWTQWPAAYVRPLKSWSIGNITLIGDAAHGTLPYMAQGAAMALEDAAELAELLKNESSAEPAFKKFYEQRSARTKKLHSASMRAGKIYHSAGLVAATRNTTLKALPSHLLLKQMAWIYHSTKI